MKHPQDMAARLYEQFPTEPLRNIKDSACCAFVLMWCMRQDQDDADAVMTAAKMMKAGALGSDCLVYWDAAARFLTGHGVYVTKESITTIKGIKERTPVLYTYNGKGHWVGVERGKIKFNPLEKSECVEKGKPAEKRVLIMKGA